MKTSSAKSLGAAILAAALLLQAAPASAGAQEWAWPVRGRVISSYSNDNSKPYAGGMHRGIDIAAPVGSDVVAGHAGRVTYAAALGSSGLTVAVRTSDDRYLTSYLHLSRIAVGRGDSVALGQKLGEVGTTGTPSTRDPHLHFGVRRADREHSYVDPLALLPALGNGAGEPAPQSAHEPVPLRAQEMPVPLAARPLAVARRAPVAQPRRLPIPRTLPRPLPAGGAKPADVPDPATARRRQPAWQPGSVPQAAVRRPVTAGSLASAEAGLSRPHPLPGEARPSARGRPRLPLAQPAAGGRADVPSTDHDGSPWGDWGRLVSLAGVVLLAAALARRSRSSLSRAAGRPEHPQPASLPATRSPVPVRPVSQMG
jgi:hypothetical protein